MSKIGSFNFALLVHGSQAITLHRPIPVEAEATVQDKVVAMYDKTKAAVVVMENEVKLASGEPLWTTRSSVFIRGEGGWGGDRGPSGPQNEPPADAAPDHEVTMQTLPDQAGFDRPILHGLCTYGITCRAILQEVTGFDADQIYSHQARFSSPVFPGDVITVDIWKDGKNISFEARVKARNVTVIRNGLTVLR